jgi:hypothetical protein
MPGYCNGGEFEMVTVRTSPTRLFAVLAIAWSLHPSRFAYAQTRSDSAGIQIVELASIQTPCIAFVVSTKPIVRLGGLHDVERAEFSPRHGFLRTLRVTDGRIVVNDYASVKIFDSTGRLLHVLGRRGNGPGEFQQTHSVCHGAGNSLIVRDNVLRRASVFTLQGKFVRTITANGSPTGSGCFSDGSLLVQTNARVSEADNTSPDRARYADRVADYHRESTSGREVRAIGSWRAFRPSAFQAPIMVQVVNDRIYIGDSQDASVRVLDGSGKLTRVVRWRAPRTRVTNELLERRVRASVPKDAPRSVIDERIAALRLEPVADLLPAFLQMLVDPSGRIWLEDYPLEARSAWWTVLDRDGSLLGRVEIPRIADARRSVTPLIVEVLPDRIALSWKDDDGAVHLGYFALTK